MPKKEGSKSFQLNAKNIALTYPRCDIHPQAMFDWLKDNFSPEAVCVAQETHKDGGFHLHAYLRFEKALYTRNQKLFDVDGFHPNVQGCREVKNWVTYIKKQGNIITTDNIDFKDGWEELLMAPNKTEFISAIRKNRPRDYILNRQRIEYHAQKEYFRTAVENPLRPLDSFRRPPITDFSKPIVMLGPPLLGKTEYLRAHFKKPFMVRHLDQFKTDLPEGTDALIFDDMTFTHLPHTTVRYLVEQSQDVVIHCRNTLGKVPGGIPRIFTGNKDSAVEVFCSTSFNEHEVNSIILRLEIVHVTQRLF